MDENTTRERAELVEAKLKRFASLRLDPAEVRASREFHYRHWLELAEAAVTRDHANLYYDGLSANVEDTVASYPGAELPADLQRAVLRDLAFMEGHLQALRDVTALLDRARKRRRRARRAAAAASE